MLRTAWAELRHHPSRLVATGLAIMIAVGFLVSCLTFVATEANSTGRRLTAQISTSDVIVQLEADRGRAIEARIRELPGVAAVAATYSTYAEFSSSEGAGQLQIDSLSEPPFRWSTLDRGHWPHGVGEVAVGAATASTHGLALGSTISLIGGPTQAPQPLQVVGILTEGRSLLVTAPTTAIVDPAFFAARADGESSPTLLIKAEPGVDPAGVADRVRRLLPADASVATSASVTADTLDQLTNGIDVFRYLLLVFGVIALLVGSMIIINTFTIIVAQRRRQLGLLRAVGASTVQVRRRLVAEATIIGVIASALGVALGLGIAAVAAGISGSLVDGLVVPPAQVAGAFVAGVVLTWLAALVPARRATRVAPLEALRPVADELSHRRTTRRRAVVSAAIVAVGAAVTTTALLVPSHNVVLAVAGSAVLAVGILACAPLFVPGLLRLLGRGAGRLGITSRLAAVNLVRNPARAAATCTALMLGVGLIVTLQVGAASVKTTLNDSLNIEFPVDVTVSTSGGPLSPAIPTALAGVPGILATTPVRSVEAQLPTADNPKNLIRVAGLLPDAGSAVKAGMTDLTDGVALAHPFTQERLGVGPGDSITVGYQGRQRSLVVRSSDIADAGMLVVTDQELSGLALNAPVTAAWARAADRDQAAQVMAGVRKVTALQPGLSVAGSLEQAASINSLLDTVLAVATGLLAVAVAIALIGVGNTLGLSVIERTRESALLRALGLQRRQLRLMLLVEAVLLALVGAVVGIVAGIGFGTIGVVALVEETHLAALRFSISAGQTAAVVVIAVLAGALASVIPGRRAALAAPTAALADT